MTGRHWKRQKRRRSASTVAVVTVGSFLFSQNSMIEAFSPVPHHSTSSRSSSFRLGFAPALTTVDEQAESFGLSFPHQPGPYPRQDLPPWLNRYATVSNDQMEFDVGRFEYSLLEHGMPVADVRQIIQTLRATANGDSRVAVGMLDFCRLLLNEEPYANNLLSKQVVLASIIHYSDCISARRQGLPEIVRSALSQNMTSSITHTSDNHNSWRNSSFQEARQTDHSWIHRSSKLPYQLPYQPPRSSSQDDQHMIHGSSKLPYQPPRTSNRYDKFSTHLSSKLPYQPPRPSTSDVDPEAAMIARGAARLKRAEMLAQAVRGASDGRAVWTQDEASQMRGMLLSMMEDWRALAIRCVACLFRLEGILYVIGQGSSLYTERSFEMVQAAREALRVHAVLAQRLGMHRLKARIEERAFLILYRRQFSVVSSVYRQNGDAMRKLSNHLLEHITRTLHNDEALMAQLEDLQVTSRVKEPFSFWKKLLGRKLMELPGTSHPMPTSKIRSSGQSSSLSVTDVNDAIALRIILRARKYTADEPDETTRARERLLCYYTQHLIRARWPELDRTQIKDYIQFPKPNGYQSLHHTSSVNAQGIDFPFEVQIRSEEMHRVAEFGVAAHWDYKLGGTSAPSFEGIRRMLRPAREKAESSLIRAGSHRGLLGSGSYLDALDRERLDLMKEKVYVFLAGETGSSEESRIAVLPVGSRVRDALSTVPPEIPNQRIGTSERRIWRNGRLTELDEKVENGDVILLTGVAETADATSLA